MTYLKFTVLPLLFLLLGCSTPTVQIQTQCLPLVIYSQDTQTEFASELKSLSNVPVIEQFLGDYKALRDADRVCING